MTPTDAPAAAVQIARVLHPRAVAVILAPTFRELVPTLAQDSADCEVCRGTGRQPEDWGPPMEECSYCEGTGRRR